MTDELTTKLNSSVTDYFEDEIAVRGCRFDLEAIKKLYLDLDKINRVMGKNLVAKIPRNPEMSDSDWEKHKEMLEREAFKLTVTITGADDGRQYGEDVTIFDGDNLPDRIETIYFTNATKYRQFSNGIEPAEQVSVTLDFGKPKLFDPNPLVSEATPNTSFVIVKAQDFSFIKSVQMVVAKNLKQNSMYSRFLHLDFSYDVGMWLLGLPTAMYFGVILSENIIDLNENFASFLWPMVVYFSGLGIVFYRFFAGYLKWAFPVNILLENRDKAFGHRMFLLAATSWLLYKLLDSLYEKFIGP